MKLNNVILLSIVGLFCSMAFLSNAQAPFGNGLEDNDYYLFPIRPYQNNSLAGTMGELRSGHFHAGLDIRTNGKTGLPVYAAADGYIFRAAVKTAGYGRALYIRHNNGESTVYAHLESFNGPVALHVRNHQYIYKQFSTNLFFKKDQFKVRKGDIIGYSGNSGSSGGPHLHFEIRDRNQHVLNPLKYNFQEIKDHTPPVVKKLALKTFGKASRVNNQFTRMEFPVQQSGSNYFVKDTIKVFGTIGIELYAYDWLDHSRFRCGITEITLDIDAKTKFKQKISSFSFAEQRNILAHMDYHQKSTTGRGFHKLYIDDGNKLKFYSSIPGKGKLYFNQPGKHRVSIEMTDSYGNKSQLSFFVKYVEPQGLAVTTEKAPKFENFTYKITDNVLKVYSKNKEKGAFPDALVFVDTDKYKLPPEYMANNNVAIYLWDLFNGSPDSIYLGGIPIRLPKQTMVPSETEYSYYGPFCNIYFPKNALFDTLFLENPLLKEENIHKIGTPGIPLRKNISVTLKSEKKITDKNKTAVYKVSGEGYFSYYGGTWKNEKITFKTRNFGNYTILSDTIPPSIKPISVNESSVAFKIYDKLSGIKSFEATINNKWVLMNYDYKTNRIWSEKLNSSEPFKGDLKLVVTDKSGNKKIYNTKIL